MCTHFNDESALKVQYNSLVDPNFEFQKNIHYASLIWHSDNVLQYQCLNFI